jgi:hypothetical protein
MPKSKKHVLTHWNNPLEGTKKLSAQLSPWKKQNWGKELNVSLMVDRQLGQHESIEVIEYYQMK